MQERNSGLKFVPLFLGLSYPILDRNNTGIMFLNFFEFFFYFFWNFLARVGWERNLGLKFFSLFLSLSQPGLDRNTTGMMFFNFSNFFAFFFLGILWIESGRLGIWGKIFFISSSAYLIPFWLEIMPEWCFLIFWIFFSIFFGIF